MKLLSAILFVMITNAGISQQKEVAAKQLYDTVYTRPQILAKYPGGEDAWKKYIKKNMKYPRKAWWDEIESEVTLKLIIEKDGTISDAWHLNTSNYGFEEEAVRLVKKSGKWIPAMQRGQPVKSEGELTIEFRLK